jgi:anti-sigma factor RsiW
MKCREVQQLFFLYCDSELDPRSAEEVNLHLEACPACRDLWGRERRLEEAITRAAWKSEGAIDDFPWENVEARVRARNAPRSTTGRWLVAAATVLLLGLVTLLAFLQLHHSGQTIIGVARSAVEHHEEYVAGKSPIQVRGPDGEAVRNFYAGELGFDVLVPEGRLVAEAVGRPVDLVGARRCTFLGGPVAYVTYRIADGDVTAILGPLKPPEPVMEAISRSPDGLIEEEIRGCRVLIATVRGVLFVAVGPTESGTLRRLLETFQARK